VTNEERQKRLDEIDRVIRVNGLEECCSHTAWMRRMLDEAVTERDAARAACVEKQKDLDAFIAQSEREKARLAADLNDVRQANDMILADMRELHITINDRVANRVADKLAQFSREKTRLTADLDHTGKALTAVQVRCTELLEETRAQRAELATLRTWKEEATRRFTAMTLSAHAAVEALTEQLALHRGVGPAVESQIAIRRWR
jgi:hypothetical protein